MRWDDDRLLVRAGDRSRRNVGGHPLIALLWPPVEPGGYSLIVDAEAVVADDEVLVRPTRGVLHRPASDVPDGSSPSSDCVPILRP